MDNLLWNSLLAFLAGVLLNFTPCVLPVIPIKIRTLLDEVGQGLRHRLFAALAFLLGCMLFFLALGAATAYLGLIWGALFQSKVFLASLCLFLLGSALATLADWTFGLPQVFYRIPGHSYLGAFSTGTVAGILSTPCAGPFLGSVLAYAFTQSTGVILTIFGSIGAGQASPYLVVLAWPGLLTRLTAARPWARQAKKLLAMVLLGGAVFFAKVLLPAGVVELLWWALAVGVVAWALMELAGAPSWVGRVLPLLSLLLMLTLGARLVARPSQAHWQHYSAAGLEAVLARKAGPLVLDFTAEWCLNCKVLENSVFVDPEVLEAIEAADAVLMKVDLTELAPERQRLLESMGGSALPFFVILNPEGKPVRRFSEMFTADEFVHALRSCCTAPP